MLATFCICDKLLHIVPVLQSNPYLRKSDIYSTLFVIFRNNLRETLNHWSWLKSEWEYRTHHLFLRPNTLCIVKAVDHIQSSHPNLKTVWGQNVSVGYGECKPREGSLLMVRLSSTSSEKEMRVSEIQDLNKTIIYTIYIIYPTSVGFYEKSHYMLNFPLWGRDYNNKNIKCGIHLKTITCSLPVHMTAEKSMWSDLI